MAFLDTGTELGGVKADNSIAALHKGETVLNAKDTAMLAASLSAVRGGGTSNLTANRQNRELKDEMTLLREEMKGYFGLGGTATRQIGSAVGKAIPSVAGAAVGDKLTDKEAVEGGDYANSPDEEYAPYSDMVKGGDDINRPKMTYPKVAGGDNPMALAGRIKEELDALYKEYKK